MNAMTTVPNDAAANETLNQIEASVLTPEARAFLLKLAARFEPRRQELLARRQTVQRAIDNGKFPDFPPETAKIRQGDWKVAPIPKDLLDRRVEITGPVDRKMIINALNSGASVFMAISKIRIRPPGATTLKASRICGTRFAERSGLRVRRESSTSSGRNWPRWWCVREDGI